MPFYVFTDEPLQIGDRYMNLFVVDIDTQVPVSVLVHNYHVRQSNNASIKELPEILKRRIKLGSAQLELFNQGE